MQITRKRRVSTTLMYVIGFIVLLVPAFQISDKKCSLIQLAVRIFTVDITELANLYGMNPLALKISLYVQMFSILGFVIFACIYLILIYMGKNVHVNYLNGALILVFTMMQIHEESACMLLGSSGFTSIFVPLLLLVCIVLEIPISIVMDRWDEAMEDAKRFEQKEAEAKADKEERLRFEGKQNRLFYHIVWKNFKSKWKDYSLLLLSNAILFAVMVVGFCMKEMLSGKYEIKKMQLFGGLSEILINAMIPMIMLSVFTIIILLFYYIKCRARNFGVFLTLGMRRNTVYYFTALEFISVFLLSIITGGVIGRICVGIIGNSMSNFLSAELDLSVLGIKPYILSVLVIVAVYIVTLMAAREIFVDFNVGKSTDLRAIAEKMPGKAGRYMLVLGLILCGYSILQYRKLYNFENEYLLLVFFIGLFLMIRYGMALWLVSERKQNTYLKKIMLHNQLFHKSKTSAGFIGVLAITQFCVLFYFSFQLIGTLIAEGEETMFPYDYVCYADESDDVFFQELQNYYQLEMYEYPMVRVSAYDSTELTENEMQGQKPIQGQHVGISESTYHALKKYVDPKYESKELGLDPNGANIHVVYQQDKSVKAQPTAFYSPRKEPLLHIGQPCRSLYIWDVRKKDIGYYFYEVKSEEIGVLTGNFRQGLRENIIVFSDEYFEKAKNFWKTTNIWHGEQIINEEDRIPDVTISQGVTKLVLINTGPNSSGVAEELEKFEDKHLQKETDIYLGFLSAGVYDSSVSYHYGKEETIESIEIERGMKIVMNLVAIILFFLMNLMIMIVKMLSEQDLNVKRAEFLTCMGMYKKSRIKLIRGEMLRYYILLPFVAAGVAAIIYTVAVFGARMYTNIDVVRYLIYFIPAWWGYTAIHFMTAYIVTTIYAHRVEGLRYGRNS